MTFLGGIRALTRVGNKGERKSAELSLNLSPGGLIMQVTYESPRAGLKTKTPGVEKVRWGNRSQVREKKRVGLAIREGRLSFLLSESS